jgi:hypothetical protein
MHLTPVELTLGDLQARHAHNAPHPRTPGLHLSDVLKDLLADKDPKRFDRSKPMDMIRVEAGFAFEHALEQALAARHPGLVRPGELVCEGVIGSPDGLDLDIDPPRLAEYKCTWMSSAPGIEDAKFWHWWIQIRCYLYMLREVCGLDLTEALLVVLFVNGDYRNSGPQLLAWRATFDRREIVEAFAMVIKHARRKGMLAA